MKSLNVCYLLFSLLALLAAGGCKPQPLAKAQAEYDADFTLKTALVDGRMSFLGVGGAIDGVENPDLAVQQGNTIRLTLVNDDGMPHDFAVPDLQVQTTMVTAKGQSTDLVFDLSRAGVFTYYCTLPGHRQAGMEGKFIVSEP